MTALNPAEVQDQLGAVSDMFQTLADRLHALSPSPEPFSQDPNFEDSPRPLNALVPRPGQPTPEELEKLGIRVKDYGQPGNNPLPPVRPYRRRQIQPHNDESQSQNAEAGPSRPVQRRDTEPAHPGASALSRGRAFNDLVVDSAPNSQVPFSAYSQESEWQSQSQQYPESQDSNAYPDTPIVTPHGSMQLNVRNSSSISASQLEEESQLLSNELVSYSQLGFSLPPELASQPTTPISRLTNHSSDRQPQLPAASQASGAILEPDPENNESECLPVSLSLSPLPTTRVSRKKVEPLPDFHFPSPDAAAQASSPVSPPASPPVAPRYQLRKRPATATLPAPVKPSKRTKSSAQAAESIVVAPTPRVITRSRQKLSKGRKD